MLINMDVIKMIIMIQPYMKPMIKDMVANLHI